MAAQGHGAIINTSSVAFLGDYGGTGYPAGKGAVNALTMAIAAELKAYGVRANVVCPGARTRLSTGVEYEKHIADLHRRGLLDEVTMRASLDSAPAEFRGPPLRLSRQRLGARRDGSDLRCRRRIRRQLRPADADGYWGTAITMTPNRGRSTTCTR